MSAKLNRGLSRSSLQKVQNHRYSQRIGCVFWEYLFCLLKIKEISRLIYFWFVVFSFLLFCRGMANQFPVFPSHYRQFAWADAPVSTSPYFLRYIRKQWTSETETVKQKTSEKEQHWTKETDKQWGSKSVKNSETEKQKTSEKRNSWLVKQRNRKTEKQQNENEKRENSERGIVDHSTETERQ